MNRCVIIIVLLSFAVSALARTATCKTKHPPCPPKSCKKNSQTDPNKCPAKKQTTEVNEINDILSRLNESAARLKSYQAEIRYLFIQDPELLDSQTLRKGRLFYKKDRAGSKLRVNFDTMKQDDADEEKYVEDFIFDGVWLTKIDFQLEKVDFYQQAEEEKPIDVFEFISHRFPMLGFTKTQHLDKQFEITLIIQKQPNSSNLIGLHLKIKKDSTYKDDYKTINVWIDNETFLPAKLLAASTQGDIFDIQLLDAEVNKNLKNAVFKLETPQHFSKNRTPLKKN